MAEIVKLVTRHNCREEIAADINIDEVYLGTVVKCSCGSHFVCADDQRDGAYWAEHNTSPTPSSPKTMGVANPRHALAQTKEIT